MTPDATLHAALFYLVLGAVVTLASIWLITEYRYLRAQETFKRRIIDDLPPLKNGRKAR